MMGNSFYRNRKKKMKKAVHKRLMPVSRIRSFSELAQKMPALERKKSISAERDIPEAEICLKENYDTIVHKTVTFNLPSLIRIRAIDREGNSIEVTY